MVPRIYVDTSVIGGCEDDEFAEWSRRLMEEFVRGEKRAVVSDLTRHEIEKAPEPVRAVLERLSRTGVEEVALSEEAAELAVSYIEGGAVSRSHVVDAQHIAIASVARVDVLVSWNFRHIVNLDRIRAYHATNIRLGYPLLEIRSPREVLREEEI